MAEFQEFDEEATGAVSGPDRRQQAARLGGAFWSLAYVVLAAFR